MKKFVAIVLLCVIAVCIFASCAPNKCEECGKEGKTSKVEIDGKSSYVCDSCKAVVDALNKLNDAINSLG